MSSLTTEQLVDAQKAGVDASFVFLNKAFEGFERLAELNVQAVKATLAENREFAVKALSAQELQDMFSQQSILAQPAGERVRSYWRHVYEILSSTQAEFAGLAEAKSRQFQSDAHAFIDGLTKNAPAGSEAVVAAWKTFITNASETANTAYETAAQAARQAAEIAESTVVPVEAAAKQ